MEKAPSSGLEGGEDVEDKRGFWEERLKGQETMRCVVIPGSRRESEDTRRKVN